MKIQRGFLPDSTIEIVVFTWRGFECIASTMFARKILLNISIRKVMLGCSFSDKNIFVCAHWT